MRNFIVHSQDSIMAKGKIYTSWNPKKINSDFFMRKKVANNLVYVSLKG